MTTVELVNLSKQYGAVEAVQDLSLQVESGELVALLGPSGCGKSTTMRMVAGLLPPSAGDIRFDGRSVLAVAPERRGAVMVFQKHLLFPHMSVADNVAFGLKMRGVDRVTRERQVTEILDLVQLPGLEKRRAHELSGGQQQRVALARALVIRPEVLLLDEPLANLDANLRLDMRCLIREVQRELGITTIFVTHDQEEAVMLADRVALMMAGRLLQFDRPRVLYDRPNSVTVARFFRNENLLRGTKRGTTVETGLGDLTVLPDVAACVPDGPVYLTIRPEQIQVASSDSKVGSVAKTNCVCGHLKGSVYLGSWTRLEVTAGAERLTVHAPATCTGDPGSPLTLYLPGAHLWILPDRPQSTSL